MSGAAEDPKTPKVSPWLVRIPEVFEGVSAEVLQKFGAAVTTRLGHDYYLINTTTPAAIHRSEAAKFARWNLPVGHTWPCNPRKMDKFVEKAAQTLAQKFGARKPQGVFFGQLNPGSPDKYFKTLASNLRGRTQQLFPDLAVSGVEEQSPTRETLFGLVGKEGLFCGMQSPRRANGLYAGGSKYIDRDSADAVSRAGAKIAEALHYLLMYRPPLSEGTHWLELGASPGGMTSELLARSHRVTAIDRAPLDKRLRGRSGLTFTRSDAITFSPPKGEAYDAILSDMNGPPEDSMRHVIRLSRFLKPRGFVIFTLKVPRVENMDATCELFDRTVRSAKAGGLRTFAQTHLTYNRHEFTLFLEPE